MDWISRSILVNDFLIPILDVALLGFLIYRGYMILFQTRAIPLIRGIALTMGVYVLALVLRLSTMTWLLNLLAPGFFVGLAIVFQPELRKIFTQIGQGSWFSSQSKPKSYHVDSVLTALEVLSGMRRGALVVFSRKVGLRNVVEGGTTLDADLSSALILTVFGHDTPLHDGGLIIQGGKVVSAGCFFPLSEQPNLRKSFGTRHRAALGLAEESDAVILIASEETGALSLAYDGALHYDLSVDQLRKRLKELLDFKDLEEGDADETKGT